MAALNSVMDNLTDLFPFENSASFDRDRQLKWCNAAVLHAMAYCKQISDIDLSYEQMLDELREGRLRAIQALLYGALKAGDDRVTVKRFGDIYKTGNILQYVEAVIDGMAHYLQPPGSKDDEKDLDPEWPDTQKEVKKKTSASHGRTGSGSARKTTSHSSSRP